MHAPISLGQEIFYLSMHFFSISTLLVSYERNAEALLVQQGRRGQLRIWWIEEHYLKIDKFKCKLTKECNHLSLYCFDLDYKY